MKLITYTIIFASLTTLLSCGNGEKKDEKKTVTIGTTEAPKQTDENSINVGLTGNDLMQYSTNEIKVKAGQEVNLTMRHIGKMDIKVMGHNFVLLKPGTEIPAFSLEAANAGEPKDWIPNDGKDVIVHTKMIGGGQSTTITFAAPEAGVYDFICSFPGHSGIMRGKFIVE
jgi:azurin